jgi:hypothetical protein
MKPRILLSSTAAIFVLAALPVVLAGAATLSIAQVTSDSNRDAETAIATDPNASANVLAGWITREESGNACGYGVSSDGGQTWPTVGIVPGIQKGSGGTFDDAGDSSVAFDQNGNAYYACLAFNSFPPGTGSAGTIFVSKSTNHGATWGDPVVALTGEDRPGNAVNVFEDHPFLTANPANGNLYLSETQFASFGKPIIVFSRSTDGGATWSAPVQVSDRGGNTSFQDSYTATGQNASTIYLTFGAFSKHSLANWDRIYIAKSTDGGLTFSKPQLLQQVTPLPSPLPNAPWRSDNTLWVAVDRSNNQIYVNYSDYNAGDADVKVMRVQDAGDHFDVQGITNLNASESGSDQFFPFITVAPGGRVDVCYQDRSYAPGNSLIFTTCSSSTDGGVSFTNQQVTTTGFDASNNTFIGDYNQQASTASLILPIFVGDGVPGGDSTAQEVFVARVTP